MHGDYLAEEPSIEAFLGRLLPGMLAGKSTREFCRFRCWSVLLRNLESGFRGSFQWIPEAYKGLVQVDRDGYGSNALMARMVEAADRANEFAPPGKNMALEVIYRIAIEELEAWYFGDREAVWRAYPRLSSSTPNQSRYWDSDAIRGGTWEAFERVLKGHGYIRGGLRKIEAAECIAGHIDPDRNRSRSFAAFRDAIRNLN